MIYFNANPLQLGVTHGRDWQTPTLFVSALLTVYCVWKGLTGTPLAFFGAVFAVGVFVWAITRSSVRWIDLDPASESYALWLVHRLEVLPDNEIEEAARCLATAHDADLALRRVVTGLQTSRLGAL